MADGLLPIGAFARAAALTVTTLRHYHEMGVLRPVRIDPDSGYRYYSAAQLLDAEVIRRLRALDLPIEQVRTVLDARDERVTALVVREHQEAMTQRLRETERMLGELHSLIAEPLRLLADRVSVRELQATDVLVRTATVSEAEFAGFLGPAYGQLAASAIELGLEFTGAGGAIYPGEDFDTEAITVTAFIPIAGVGEPQPPVQRATLPGGRFAVAVHEGPYENVHATYRSIGVWLAGHEPQQGYAIREYYLVSPSETQNPAEYRTEIAWPLADEHVLAPISPQA